MHCGEACLDVARPNVNSEEAGPPATFEATALSPASSRLRKAITSPTSRQASPQCSCGEAAKQKSRGSPRPFVHSQLSILNPQLRVHGDSRGLRDVAVVGVVLSQADAKCQATAR